VILRWCTQRGIAVIPKSNSRERLLENLNTGEFSLTEEEIKAISALDKGLRFNNPPDVCVCLFCFVDLTFEN
jgi:D-xylose reductase